MKISNKSLESEFVKGIAEDMIYKYRNIQPFQNIILKDIIFIREESLSSSFSKDIEIYIADPLLSTLNGIHFVVIAAKSFDNLSKYEQYRKVFHVLCHIPSNYKANVKENKPLILTKHSLELFEQESTYIHDINEEIKEKDKIDNQNKIRRNPLPY